MYNNEENNIIDNYTISGFLKDNPNLYKYLEYDPYSKKDIDEKGSSYLRIDYNSGYNLSNLREKQINNEKLQIEQDNLYEELVKQWEVQKNYNHTMNEQSLNSIIYKTKIITIWGYISCGYLLLLSIIILINKFYEYSKFRK